MNLDLISAIIGSLARKALSAGGGALVLAGYASDSQATDAEGALLILGSFVWSVWQKYRANRQLKLAKSLPAESTIGGV